LHNNGKQHKGGKREDREEGMKGFMFEPTSEEAGWKQNV
jgi:hypothetical protein